MSDRVYCTREKGCERHPAKSEKDLGFSSMPPLDLSWMLSNKKERAAAYQQHLEAAEMRKKLWETPQEHPDPRCIVAGEIASGVRSCQTCAYFVERRERAVDLCGGSREFLSTYCRRYPAAVQKVGHDYCGQWEEKP